MDGAGDGYRQFRRERNWSHAVRPKGSGQGRPLTAHVLSLPRLRTSKPRISGNPACISKLERVMGIEPTFSAWEADVLPLNYTRHAPAQQLYQRFTSARGAADRYQALHTPGQHLSGPLRTGPAPAPDTLRTARRNTLRNSVAYPARARAGAPEIGTWARVN